MDKLFIIISVSDRLGDLNALVGSIVAHKRFDDYGIALMYQDYQGNAAQIEHRERYTDIFVEPERMGCHAARVALLQRVSADVYVNLDDDMLLTEHTRYDRAIAKALEPDTGFVLTNWARYQAQLVQKVPKMVDRFVPQILIYQGGGMVYADKIARLMRELPLEKMRFDDIWPITAYVNGYRNYRYLGSLALHFIGSRGGMRSFLNEETTQLASEDYIEYRKGKRDDYLIPEDSDVKPYAHEMHKAARRRWTITASH